MIDWYSPNGDRLDTEGNKTIHNLRREGEGRSIFKLYIGGVRSSDSGEYSCIGSLIIDAYPGILHVSREELLSVQSKE